MEYMHTTPITGAIPYSSTLNEAGKSHSVSFSQDHTANLNKSQSKVIFLSRLSCHILGKPHNGAFRLF